MNLPGPAPVGSERQPALTPIRTLIYTVAYDERGKNAQALMARILTASLHRCGYCGDIAVFHNQRHALFEHGRRGLTEIRISARDLPREPWRRTPHRLKFTAEPKDRRSEQWELGGERQLLWRSDGGMGPD
jgi:hypothetical protein